MKNQMLITVFISILMSIRLFAHGEESPGPNGGHIRMPGAFHTELVPLDKNQFKVYMLDVDWKNPIIEKSFVEGSLLYKKKKIPFECKPEQNYFLCDLSSVAGLKSPFVIEIKSSRQGLRGGIVTYKFPLKFLKGHKH